MRACHDTDEQSRLITPQKTPMPSSVIAQMCALTAPKKAASTIASRPSVTNDAINTAEPGDLIPGQGVYVGRWEPRDRKGKSLGKVFNVFAAPQDLTDNSGMRSIFRKANVFKYPDAVRRIGLLKNWHGFDGGNYANEEALRYALKNGRYKGEWVIPPGELLDGRRIDGNTTQPDSLWAHRDKGALKGTIKPRSLVFPFWYWSSTEHRDFQSYVWTVRFSDGDGGWHHKDNGRLNCRPVRLVEVSAPAP